MLRKDKQTYKPITFKTATLIVVTLHVVAFVGLSYWSSSKAKVAKLQWREKKQQLLEQKVSSTNDWNNAHHKPVVAATPSKQQFKLNKKPTQQQIVKIEPRRIVKVNPAQNIIKNSSEQRYSKPINSTQLITKQPPSAKPNTHIATTKTPVSTITRKYFTGGLETEEITSYVISSHIVLQ
jgi:hypothetical protein